MRLINPRTFTAILLVAMTILQFSLVIHFWQTFDSGDAAGGAILVAIAGAMALNEVLMGAVAADRLRNGLTLEGAVWLILFVAVLFTSAAAEYGAISHITTADHDERVQQRYIYDQQQGDLQRTDTELAALRKRLDADNLNIPSAAIAAELAAQQEVARRYEEADAQVPASYVRRIAKLESARITAEEIERKTSQRDTVSNGLRDREGKPQGEHPQFAALASLLGMTADQIRTMLPALMVVIFKLVTVSGFWVIARRDGGSGDDEPPRDVSNAGDPGPDDDDLDDGMAARNAAADSRTAPPPDAQPGRRRAEPVGDGDGDIFEQFNDLYDQ